MPLVKDFTDYSRSSQFRILQWLEKNSEASTESESMASQSADDDTDTVNDIDAHYPTRAG